MEAIDRSGRKVSRKMAADRLPQRIGRGEREAMRRKPGKHLLDRVRPQFLWREDIGASSRTLLEQAAGKTFARAPQRSRRGDFVRPDLAAEGNAAGLRQSPVIVGGAEPAVGDHHRVRQHAPFLGERLGAMQRRAVDETFKQKGVVGCGERGRVGAVAPKRFQHDAQDCPAARDCPPQLFHEYLEVVEPAQYSTKIINIFIKTT